MAQEEKYDPDVPTTLSGILGWLRGEASRYRTFNQPGKAQEIETMLVNLMARQSRLTLDANAEVLQVVSWGRPKMKKA